MEVAIVGAGISGLSCAVELARYGIEPVIFEKSETLGDRPGNLVATHRMFCQSIISPMYHLSSKYGINITPLHPVWEITMQTPNKKMSIKANHGYVFQKGPGRNSIEHQIASVKDFNISFGCHMDLEDVRGKYDCIVAATGDDLFGRQMNIWKPSFYAQIRVATISGDFNPYALKMWFNKKYFKNGYAYLMPKNEHEAELVLIVSDISHDKLDFYWREFLLGEDLKYAPVKFNDIEHRLGQPSICQSGNIYLIGNSGGMIDDFLGFGLTKAVESGVLCARAIANGMDFNKIIRWHTAEVKKIHEYRKMFNVLKNEDLDIDLSIIRFPPLKHLIYNNMLYKARYGIIAPKIITRFGLHH